jgi:predicted RNA-binding Zn-ribbon protein involved in translation (DUF1610 family)
MGHKKVCLDCKISFNREFDSGSELTYPCPECGKSMTLLPHRFRPPKKTDENKWEVVKFLIDNGFYYQHISEPITIDNTKYVEYPDNLREAEEFVMKYKNQARK